MSYAKIQSALDDYLQQVSGLPELQLENTRNIGRTGQPFARATMTTTEAVKVGLMTRYEGLYIVDFYYPQDTGTADANAMADAVIEHFKAAPLHRIETGDVIVQLMREWRETVGRREPHYALQVKVRWHALI